MSTPFSWLDWTPSQRQIMESPPETEPTKPSEGAFVGFDGSISRENPIIEPTPQPEPAPPVMGNALYTEPTKPSEAMEHPQTVGASTELPPLAGRKNARGQMVLTVEDIPELEKHLRWQGWKVKRQGLELICTSPGGVRIQ